MKNKLGFACLAAFIACVFLANYFIQHIGTLAFPGGPHVITILGLTAPSGVLVVGLSFTLRDLAQMSLGKAWIVAGIVIGATLSYFVAPSLAWASGCAFLISEGLDYLAYTPLADRGRWLAGVALSNTVGSFIDTLVFLWLAFHSLEFFAGQFWFKLLMTVPALLILAPIRFTARRKALA